MTRFQASPRSRAWAPAVVLSLVALAVGTAMAVLSVGYDGFAIPVAVALLVLGVASVDMTLVPIVAVPATLALMRVGGEIAVADVALAAGTIVALFLLRGSGALAMQPLLVAGSLYLVLAVPTLIINPYTANLVEWVHEVFLVLGSMVVGFAIGRGGRARMALSIYVMVCAGLGVIAVFLALQTLLSNGQFLPVYIGDLHKNTLGGMLATAAIIAYARPPWIGWARGSAQLGVVLCLSGVLATQSRQGMIAAGVGMLIVGVRPIVRGMRRPKLIWILAAAVTIGIVVSVNQQLSEDNPYNSANARLAWFDSSFEIWRESPVFGNGLRWWYTDRFGESFQPPNAELEVLTSVGVVGLVGFLLMFLVAAVALMRMEPVYGTVAVAVVAGRFAQAQFDLYWVAGQASLLWIVAGIVYGVRERDRFLGLDRTATAMREHAAQIGVTHGGSGRERVARVDNTGGPTSGPR